MNLKGLLSWSLSEYHSLPWRTDRSLYKTLVSEIMLQQTTVGTVRNHYDRFLNQFPDLKSLAEASDDEMTVAWKGLGYYRRARNLKKIAECLVNDYQGEFPHDVDRLMEISGIGPYTANALVGIGMDKRALAVDANLERVIARLFALKSPKGLKLQKEIQNLFQEKKIFPKVSSYRALNEALMDLGRTVCQARKASCELCPLKNDCKAFELGSPLAFPAESSTTIKKPEAHELHLLRILVQKKDQILVYQKSEKEWLSGQYELPTFILKTTDPNLKQYPRLKKKIKAQFEFKTGITKYKIQNSVLILSESEFKKLSFPVKSHWRSVTDQQANFTTATSKALKHLALHQ